MYKITKAVFIKAIMSKIRAYPIEFFIGNLLTAFYNVLGAFIIYEYVFKGNISSAHYEFTNRSSYVSFVVIGTAIYLFCVSTILNVSRSLISEMRDGTLDALLITPIKTAHYFSGYMIEDIFSSGLEIFAAVLLAIPFGFYVNFSDINPWAVILSIVFTCVSCYGIAVIICGVMVLMKDTFVTQNTSFQIICLICGVLYPIEYLPTFVQFLGKCLPLTHAINVMRNTLLHGLSLSSQLHEFGLLILTSVLYSIIGTYFVNKVIRIAPEIKYL